MFQSFRQSYFAYFLMFHFYFLSWALFSTLISVSLLDLGFRPSQVSLVVGTSYLSSMLTQPVIGHLTDRLNRKWVLISLFALAMLGGLGMMVSRNLLAITVFYSFVMLLMAGSSPLMEQLATSSRFAYGKLRIWGTIGYALGSQLAGLIYQWIAPQAVYLAFSVMLGLAIIGVLGTVTATPVAAVIKSSHSPVKQLLLNKRLLGFMILSVLLSGILMTGHTYIPAYLESSGLTVAQSTTVVALAVICEAPLTYFSYLFMDRFTSKQLIAAAISLLFIQYLVYTLDFGLLSKVIITLLGKHTGGIILIMVNMKVVNSLVDKSVLLTALALVQTARNLGTILFQNLAGQILDQWSYHQLFLMILGFIVMSAGLLFVLKLPKGTQENLFQ